MDEKHLATLLWTVKACLLAVLIYAGFEVVVPHLHLDAALDPRAARGERHATDPQGSEPSIHTPPDYGTIVERDLFDTARSADRSPATPPPQARESMTPAEELGLRLIGTIAGGPTASRAILQDTRSKMTRSCRIGDTLASATVEAIQRDAVILRYQGRPFVVKLSPGSTDGSGQKAQTLSQETPDAKPRAEDQSKASYPESSRWGYVVEVFRKATIEPYINRNRTEGLKVTGLENLPMAQQFGLKNGDVVQSVNGQPLTSKQKAFQVLMKAKMQPKVDIQLLRDGKSTNLSFKL